MIARALTARRLVLPAGESAGLCARLGLRTPPGFDATPTTVRTPDVLRHGAVHPSVAAGLAATCSPQVGVLLQSTPGDVTAAFGIRADLGGSMVRAGDSDVELSVWPATRLGDELGRVVPALGHSTVPALHLPLHDLPHCSELREAVVGRLHATVVVPPRVIGRIVWLADDSGWLALTPAEVRNGSRWATVSPVGPDDIGAALAPLVAAALA